MGTYDFILTLHGLIANTSPAPIYDDSGTLVGAYTTYGIDMLKCFVAKKGYPDAIIIESGQNFWFTPTLVDGKLTSGTISLTKINLDSILVKGRNQHEYPQFTPDGE